MNAELLAEVVRDGNADELATLEMQAIGGLRHKSFTVHGIFHGCSILLFHKVFL